MARLNKDAREILCNMVDEKAKEKREALVAELDRLDESFKNDYKKRLCDASKELEGVINRARKEVDEVLVAYGLKWGTMRYGSGVSNINSIIDSYDGKLKSDLDDYIKDKSTSKKREGLKREIDELDAKVAKAKQEIILRAALGMNYDEVVAIVNGFEF